MATKIDSFKSNVPTLNGSNYNFWKIRITIYLQSLDERIWQLDGYNRPTITVEGNNGPKPVALWTAKELEAAKFNS